MTRILAPDWSVFRRTSWGRDVARLIVFVFLSCFRQEVACIVRFLPWDVLRWCRGCPRPCVPNRVMTWKINRVITVLFCSFLSCFKPPEWRPTSSDVFRHQVRPYPILLWARVFFSYRFVWFMTAKAFLACFTLSSQTFNLFCVINIKLWYSGLLSKRKVAAVTCELEQIQAARTLTDYELQSHKYIHEFFDHSRNIGQKGRKMI